MAGNKAIEHVTDMVVLGGDFQVGELYDYRIDRIVSGKWFLYIQKIAFRTVQSIERYVKQAGRAGN